MNNALPTMDVLQQRSPTIINQKTECRTCSSHTETNNLLWLCPTNLEILRPHIVTYVNQLSDTIRQTCDNEDFIEQEINNNKIFQFFLAPTNTLSTPTTQNPFYLTCRQIITAELVSLFRGKYKYKKTLHKMILDSFYNLTQLIKCIIWKPRNEAFKKWKASKNINKNTCKTYHHNKRNQAKMNERTHLLMIFLQRLRITDLTIISYVKDISIKRPPLNRYKIIASHLYTRRQATLDIME
ncbi:hypothetical protein RclHR1_03730011 [Rhizophagus clarus]|uniref:Uncharacterized protein n=1 Tax=Rhizophagus clarus TaxID=94130 RepID=A0A2Z6RU24_9GLOM|nr:hypothetical protein RclHR1_03730011 [Rhizophagus clarus]GES79929.1 hypothetical protein GLOIN_2v1790609 [Rhizophagus clarus]